MVGEIYLGDNKGIDFWLIKLKEKLVKGYINQEGWIDISEVIWCLRMAIRSNEKEIELVDMNNNGEIDIADVILILRKKWLE